MAALRFGLAIATTLRNAPKWSGDAMRQARTANWALLDRLKEIADELMSSPALERSRRYGVGECSVTNLSLSAMW